MEQRRVDEVEPLGDRLDVLADLLTECVAILRDALHLLEHRHVAVRLDVAHHTRIAVPVPGAAEPTGSVDQADLPDADLAQLGTRHHTRHARADDRDVDVVDDGIARSHRGERILEVPREHLVVGQVVDRRTTLDHALVPLDLVLRADLLRFEAGPVAAHVRHRHTPSQASAGPGEHTTGRGRSPRVARVGPSLPTPGSSAMLPDPRRRERESDDQHR